MPIPLYRDNEFKFKINYLISLLSPHLFTYHTYPFYSQTYTTIPTPLSEIYDLYCNFDNDPQEFYLIKKGNYSKDPYIPNIKFTESTSYYQDPHKFYSISKYSSTDNSSSNLIKLPLDKSTSEQITANLKSYLNFQQPYQFGNHTFPNTYLGHQFSNSAFQKFSELLSPLKDFLNSEIFQKFSPKLKEKIKQQFYKTRTDEAVSEKEFEKKIIANQDICKLLNSIYEYVSSQPYQQDTKDEIIQQFDSQLVNLGKDEEIDKNILIREINLAIENVNPFFSEQKNSQQHDIFFIPDSSKSSTPATQIYQSVWQNLQVTSPEKIGNISKRGNRVIPENDKIRNYFDQNEDSSKLLDSREIEQTHVKDLVEKREQAIETLYFSFIGKALEDTKKINPQFSFQDALLALRIAKNFGGVTNKLNDQGDGYENLKLEEVNMFLNSQENSLGNTPILASAIASKKIDDQKFNQLKKFSKLYQKHAGQYFKSARDSKTNIRLTFFPDRFMNKLISKDGEKIVTQAKEKICKIPNSGLRV